MHHTAAFMHPRSLLLSYQLPGLSLTLLLSLKLRVSTGYRGAAPSPRAGRCCAMSCIVAGCAGSPARARPAHAPGPVRRPSVYGATNTSLSGEKYVRSSLPLDRRRHSVKQLFRVPEGFSARFDAQARSYRYRICAGGARPVLGWDYGSVRTAADMNLSMDKAAQARWEARLQELL